MLLLTRPRAEIIKIEHPTRGDDTRAWGPPFAKYSEGDDARHVGPPFAKQIIGQSRTGPGESAYFMAVSLSHLLCLAFGIDLVTGQSKQEIPGTILPAPPRR